ncbi:Bug family tripartite tricarboxylate transporter substrate binding protein [Falsiroseomonas frigidaquae]|uniref:Bug family tripartite tricarboxylate transporter substrate binding protein n=1 Tax=Falsiroseomonas frigidaquae TaxID=487318 RepID=UPI001FD7FE65|nr:tripartite tricarboxylate transporter substrate-binding protein [Falsiroseomonas frigidaquae]
MSIKSINLLRRHVLASIGLLAAPAIARAQSGWPDRPIRLIVPFGAGGAIDTLSRTVAAKFPEVTGGQTLVVENRPGAGGTIAGAAVAREKPDGLTLMMADVGANAIGKELIPSLSYEPPTAFTPIIHLVNLPAVLMAHPTVTATTVQQVIEQAKARPDGFTYSSAGNGNGSHLFMALFLKEAGISMVHVPYRSGAEMVTALIRGDAQFGFPTVSSGIGQIRQGNAKAIAVGNAAGTPLLPNTPAISTVMPGFEVAVWHGIVAPAGMDAGLAREINQVFGRIAAMPDVKQRIFDTQAGTVVGGSPADFAAHIAREVARWTPIIRQGGIASG